MNQNGINCSVIFYSQTGNVLEMADVVAEAAREEGAEVRLRRVPELAPDEVVASHEGWSATQEAMAAIPLAALGDLEWADAVLFGSPTRYGLASSQLKQFIDMTGPLWQEGKLAGKVYGAFTSAATLHGGHESTLLSLAHVFHHWGGIIVPPGYTDPIQFKAGNPYGSSHNSGAGRLTSVESEALKHQVRHALSVAGALKRGRHVSGAA